MKNIQLAVEGLANVCVIIAAVILALSIVAFMCFWKARKARRDLALA